MMQNIVPKKSLGQHWLHDAAALDGIISAVGVTAGDVVLEIGPGLGTLTEKLLHRGARVTAVEFDHHLAEKLAARNWGSLPKTAAVAVVEQDILSFDLGSLSTGYKVIANIPYYLTSNLIRVLCESQNSFSSAALLIQKEVAQRVVAAPGDMSLLSVSTQYYCEASLGIEVPARLFTPPPKVDSQVLVLHHRPAPLFSDVDTKGFLRIVRAGFSQKRKTLVNALSGGLQLSKPDAAALVASAGLDLTIRAQALSLENWKSLYDEWEKSDI